MVGTKLKADLTEKKFFFDFLWDDLRVFYKAQNYDFLGNLGVNLIVDCVKLEVKFQFSVLEADFSRGQVENYDEIYGDDYSSRMFSKKWILWKAYTFKMSFLAGPNQNTLHTDALDAGDRRPTRWSFNLMLWSRQKKSLFLK